MGNRVRNTTFAPALAFWGALFFLSNAHLREFLPPELHREVILATAVITVEYLIYFSIYWFILSGRFTLRDGTDPEMTLRYALTDKKAEVGQGWAWNPQLKYWVAVCGAAVLLCYVVFLFTW